jgi:hypothetical protein
MKRIIKAGLMVLLGAAIWTNGGDVKEAKAQYCAPGGQVVENVGSSYCYYANGSCPTHLAGTSYIPPSCLPQQQTPTNTRPVPPKPSSYGAFVHNKKTNAIGESSRKSTSNEALRSAYIKANCQTENDCAVVSTYQNQCVALAWGKSFFESRGGNTETAAKKSALSACGKASKNCQIVMTSCSPAGEIDNAQQYKGLGE